MRLYGPLVFTSIFQEEFDPEVIVDSLPSTDNFNEPMLFLNTTIGYTTITYGHNFAHLLIDELYSAISAMDIFDIPEQDRQVAYSSCDKLIGNSEYILSPPTTRVDQCENNFALYSSLLFGEDRPALRLHDFIGTQFCMRQVIVGHSYVFSVLKTDYLRNMQLRKGRDLIVRRLGLLESTPRPTRQTVLVLIKGPSTKGLQGKWPTICEDIQNLMMQMEEGFRDVPVVCVSPTFMSLSDQVIVARNATVIVAEHGTNSYGALWARRYGVDISGCPGTNARTKCETHKSYCLPRIYASNSLHTITQMALRNC